MSKETSKNRAITRVLVIEGVVNLLLCLIKLIIGFVTQSSVILADALHSLTDLTNNIIAIVAMRIILIPTVIRNLNTWLSLF